MKTKQLLVLPMVALLAACNKGGTQADFFAKFKNDHKVNSDKMIEVRDAVDGFKIETKHSVKTVSYTRDSANDEWREISNETVTYFSLTAYSKDWHFVSLSYEQRDSYSEEDLTLCYMVNKNGDNYIITESTYPYNTDKKSLYHLTLNSIFSWTYTFFSGSVYYLAHRDVNKYMPKQALQKLTKNFTVSSADGEGNYIFDGGNPNLVYKSGNNSYRIDSYHTSYKLYLLYSYNVKFFSSIQDSATHKVETTRELTSFITVE